LYSLYNFHFLDTVSKQLLEMLSGLGISSLNQLELSKLQAFQEENHSKKGVYLLHYQGNPVYLGKADDIAERLQQHYYKLCGRENIDIDEIGFKCIVLDESMSTAANEELLISLFQRDHSGMWNNSGFGAKDPGRQRDSTKPGAFDQQHPIRKDYDLEFRDINGTIGDFVAQAKQQLPYIFRFEISADLLSRPISISPIRLTVEEFVSQLVKYLGPDYQANILSFGITIYAEEKEYQYGKVIRANTLN